VTAKMIYVFLLFFEKIIYFRTKNGAFFIKKQIFPFEKRKYNNSKSRNLLIVKKRGKDNGRL